MRGMSLQRGGRIALANWKHSTHYVLQKPTVQHHITDAPTYNKPITPKTNPPWQP